jgi:DNA-binding HxlR family transcriptional regulator
MDRKKIDEYLEKFPIEIREPIMALNNDQKWALFIALTLDKEMYFNEIKKLFNANANTIDTNLKVLVASGLIAKKAKKIADLKNQEKIYYHATEFGKSLIYTLCDIGMPQTPIKLDIPIITDLEQYKYKMTVKSPISNYIIHQIPNKNFKKYVKNDIDYKEIFGINFQEFIEIKKVEV